MMSVFLIHVMEIIGLGSKEKMVGINTVPNIAFVQDAKPIWDFSVVENPGESMAEDGMVVSCIERTIPFVVEFPSPNPTGFSLINFSPEAFLSRVKHMMLPLGIATKFALCYYISQWVNF